MREAPGLLQVIALAAATEVLMRIRDGKFALEADCAEMAFRAVPNEPEIGPTTATSLRHGLLRSQRLSILIPLVD
jgi:hypothetical protein